jgi:hypothetical protein
VVASSAHGSDGLSDISGPLLLPSIVAAGSMTSDDRYYSRARGTRVGVNNAHNSEGSSHINRLLLLSPTITTGSMTSQDRCY